MNNIVNDIINMSYIIDRRDTMLLSILNNDKDEEIHLKLF